MRSKSIVRSKVTVQFKGSPHVKQPPPTHARSNMAVRERKFFVGGNWKMNGITSSVDAIVEFLKAGPLSPNAGTVLALSAPNFMLQLPRRRNRIHITVGRPEHCDTLVAFFTWQ